jgi:hypothetical protein
LKFWFWVYEFEFSIFNHCFWIYDSLIFLYWIYNWRPSILNFSYWFLLQLHNVNLQRLPQLWPQLSTSNFQILNFNFQPLTWNFHFQVFIICQFSIFDFWLSISLIVNHRLLISDYSVSNFDFWFWIIVKFHFWLGIDFQHLIFSIKSF